MTSTSLIELLNNMILILRNKLFYLGLNQLFTNYVVNIIMEEHKLQEINRVVKI
jgi:hypothetical protein